jgi:hypothetical protein
MLRESFFQGFWKRRPYFYYWQNVKITTISIYNDLTNTYFEGEKKFEQELQKIHAVLHNKGGVKKNDKFHLWIGRAKENILPSSNTMTLP